MLNLECCSTEQAQKNGKLLPIYWKPRVPNLRILPRRSVGKANLPLSTLLGNEPSYTEIVRQVAEKLGINSTGFQLEDLEIEIARKVLQTAWDKMTPDQQASMDSELRKAAQEFGKGRALAESASVFATLTAAQLSGFGVYLLASTALGTLSGVIGITPSFRGLYHDVKRNRGNNWPGRVDWCRALRDLETHWGRL